MFRRANQHTHLHTCTLAHWHTGTLAPFKPVHIKTYLGALKLCGKTTFKGWSTMSWPNNLWYK